jgi:hypothetical protein
LWVAAVARELGISKTLVHRWSSKHDWLERAEAFDRADYQRRLEANIAQSVEMQTRHTAIAKEALAKVPDSDSPTRPGEGQVFYGGQAFGSIIDGIPSAPPAGAGSSCLGHDQCHDGRSCAGRRGRSAEVKHNAIGNALREINGRWCRDKKGATWEATARMQF